MRKWLAHKYIRWKSGHWLKQLRTPLKFPIHATSVQRVLVILPRNLMLLDQASQFVQQLRQTYRYWQVDIFDVDKIPPDQLTWLKLPRQDYLNRFRAAGYHIVIDLNDFLDLTSAYVATYCQAPYRLHLKDHNNMFFNIHYTAGSQNTPNPFHGLMTTLRQLFI